MVGSEPRPGGRNPRGGGDRRHDETRVGRERHGRTDRRPPGNTAPSKRTPASRDTSNRKGSSRSSAAPAARDSLTGDSNRMEVRPLRSGTAMREGKPPKAKAHECHRHETRPGGRTSGTRRREVEKTWGRSTAGRGNPAQVAAHRLMRCRARNLMRGRPRHETWTPRTSRRTDHVTRPATVCERTLHRWRSDTLDAKPTAREADRSRKRPLGANS